MSEPREYAMSFCLTLVWFIVLANIIIYLIGCVKTVHLPQDANYYRLKANELESNLKICRSNLNLCLELGEALRRD